MSTFFDDERFDRLSLESIWAYPSEEEGCWEAWAHWEPCPPNAEDEDLGDISYRFCAFLEGPDLVPEIVRREHFSVSSFDRSGPKQNDRLAIEQLDRDDEKWRLRKLYAWLLGGDEGLAEACEWAATTTTLTRDEKSLVDEYVTLVAFDGYTRGRATFEERWGRKQLLQTANETPYIQVHIRNDEVIVDLGWSLDDNNYFRLEQPQLDRLSLVISYCAHSAIVFEDPEVEFAMHMVWDDCDMVFGERGSGDVATTNGLSDEANRLLAQWFSLDLSKEWYVWSLASHESLHRYWRAFIGYVIDGEAGE